QVVVKPTGAPTEVTLVPIASETKTAVNWRKVGGFAAIGAGVGLGVVGLVSSLNVNSVKSDANYTALREAYPKSTDVCEDGKGNKAFTAIVADCNSAKSAQTMQIIFYPLAAVAGGLGIYLIATSSSAPKPPTTGFKIDPRVGLDGGKLDVTYTW
ncbi:MAG: hypothetical protein ABI134_23735, partial [Byssovorax sp.]